MPITPEGHEWDLEAPGSRFTLRPAFTVGFPENEWPYNPSEEEIKALAIQGLGEWVLEEQDELGRPDVLEGSVGRGAAGWTLVVEWLVQPAVHGVVSLAAAAVALKIWKRARGEAKGSEQRADSLDRSEEWRGLVSRGYAVLLARAFIHHEYTDSRPLELEAAEEPSAIAGRPTHEVNYVGIEPWIVLLRDRQELRRYVVVVGPDGNVLGSLQVPISEWEPMFF